MAWIPGDEESESGNSTLVRRMGVKSMNKVKASLAMLGITAAAVVCMAVACGQGQRMAMCQVETCQVEIGQVEQVLVLDGSLRYEMEYAAMAPVTGVVEDVYVKAGEAVQAGQALFRLNDQTQVKTVSAALAGQERLPDVVGEELTATRLQEAAAQLECLTVRAATDGLVQQVNITPYGGVAAGTSAVLLSGREQRIQCSAVLKDAERLHAGMEARIIKDGSVLTTATLESIGLAQVSQATGQAVCQLSLVPKKSINNLPLGAAVEVEIILQKEEGVPVLPVETITSQDTVWWVADGRSYEIPVQVLLADEAMCWVNLPQGTRVICGGEVAQGQQVKEMAP